MSSLRKEDYVIWQDSEVRVDCSKSSCALRRGEVLIDSLDSVEDSKGASGERGRLMVTNLRLLWVCHASPSHNVSIGWECMAAGRSGVAVKSAHSRLRGSLQALVVCATFEASRYDFIFTSLVRASPRLFATAQAVHKAFETSRAYRTLRLRGAIIRPEDKAVVLLPRERVFTQLEGVWNLANESGNLGACTVTNQRFVWRATLTENFNVSIPYLIMVRVCWRGKAARCVCLAHTHPSPLKTRHPHPPPRPR
jgi:Bardet-Biedl syndrome 5 protein